MDHDDSDGTITAMTIESATPDATPADPVTREQRRSRRKRAVRSRTISVKRMTKRDLQLGQMLFPLDENNPKRPAKRSECEAARGHDENGKPNPCPFVSCAFNLYLDVHPRTGGIKLNFPDIEPDQMTESCVLDVADRQGTTLEETGGILNLTRERIRQIEVRAMAKMSAIGETFALRDFADEGPVGKRRLPMLVRKPDPFEDLDDEPENDEAPAIIDDAPDFDAFEVAP